ncbi:hypothetical protein IEQ34_017720 [Dendrobium chrysotoxum]|uniref:Uncharacterized protein n=1 Tax=Dendrobium chrysotoxum TaxID=161865 RepID=A0AAV7GAZ9_DENCH|nr:hypothetical protein IEQ34_017720 [Dendrobium chrysotoxum]
MSEVIEAHVNTTIQGVGSENSAPASARLVFFGGSFNGIKFRSKFLKANSSFEFKQVQDDFLFIRNFGSLPVSPLFRKNFGKLGHPTTLIKACMIGVFRYRARVFIPTTLIKACMGLSMVPDSKEEQLFPRRYRAAYGYLKLSPPC